VLRTVSARKERKNGVGQGGGVGSALTLCGGDCTQVMDKLADNWDQLMDVLLPCDGEDMLLEQRHAQSKRGWLGCFKDMEFDRAMGAASVPRLLDNSPDRCAHVRLPPAFPSPRPWSRRTDMALTVLLFRRVQWLRVALQRSRLSLCRHAVRCRVLLRLRGHQQLRQAWQDNGLRHALPR
jgi:hypothetical protein